MTGERRLSCPDAQRIEVIDYPDCDCPLVRVHRRGQYLEFPHARMRQRLEWVAVLPQGGE